MKIKITVIFFLLLSTFTAQSKSGQRPVQIICGNASYGQFHHIDVSQHSAKSEIVRGLFTAVAVPLTSQAPVQLNERLPIAQTCKIYADRGLTVYCQALKSATRFQSIDAIKIEHPISGPMLALNGWDLRQKARINLARVVPNHLVCEIRAN